MKTFKITKAEYSGGHKVELTFNDAEKRIVDFGIFLKKRPHPQHDKYNNLENFKKFKLENGNIVWGKNWDMIFPPEQLYEGKIQI